MALPGGFRVALDPGARFLGGDGTALVGGSPIRLLRLTPSGRSLVDRLAAGEPVPPSPAAQALTRRLLDAGLAHPRPPAPASPPDVAVVIPVRNDAGGLAATLAALGPGPEAAALRVTPPMPGPDPAVVVVDDASVDANPVDGICRTQGATLLRRTAWGGPGAARNDGWRAAAAEFVAFVDANCEPEAGWLEALLPHFADPKVAAVAPRIVPAAEVAAPRWLAAYEEVSSPLDLGGREANVRPRSPVAYVPTAALVVRRSALEALGGFDEARTVGEDVDLVWRLAAAGWTVRYEPRATVRHPIRPTGAAWLAQRYRYGTSAAALARRHGRAVAPAVVSPWTAAAWALAAAGRPVLGAAVAGYSTTALARRLAVPGTTRIAATGHLQGGLTLARALRRTWAPAAVVLAVASRRSRPALAAAVAVPPVLDWLDRRPRLDPIRFVALRLADDFAYAAGVWAGCRRERSIRALRPDLGGAGAEPVRQTDGPVAAPIGGAP